MNIGFYRAGLIGDNIVVLHAIYALRHLYKDSKIIVYTNSCGGGGVTLYAQFEFIDSIINIESMDNENLIKNINANNFDIFILTQPNRAKCRLLAQTTCKRIITFMTFANSLNYRFESVFIPKHLNHTPQYQRMLQLVRKINPKHYDKNIATIDYSYIRFKSSDKNKAKIKEFIESRHIQQKIVVVNPFVRSTFCNLTLCGYEKLLYKLSGLYPNLHFVIPTYKGNEAGNTELLKLQSLHNVSIFYNDDDLINLVALLKQSIALISPSTAISHLANNLNMPLIWLCSKRDSYLWSGDNMDSKYFVILHKTTQNMNETDEIVAINEIIEKLQDIVSRK